MVLDNGTVSAIGTHSQLMECSEIYRDIYLNAVHNIRDACNRCCGNTGFKSVSCAVFGYVGAFVDALKHLYVGFNGFCGVSALGKLALDTVCTDLIKLIEDDEYLIVVLLREACLFCHCLKETAVVDPYGEALKSDLSESCECSADELDLSKAGCITENVDVALHELTEAALLRSFRSPYITYLECLEGNGKIVCIVCVVA